MVLFNVESARITPTFTAFVAPNFHSALTIDTLATSIKAVQARKKHTEAIRVYRKFKHVEKALLRHIHNSIEELADEDTGLIEYNIPMVLEYLFKKYGKVQ